MRSCFDPLTMRILDILSTEEYKTITAVCFALKDKSVTKQAVAARLLNLHSYGKVEKAPIMVDGIKKVNCYRKRG